MNNIERIQISLRLLLHYLNELDEIVPLAYEEYSHSLLLRRSSERQIQIIIEQVTDICALLCRARCSGIPGDDAGILDSLAGNCLSVEMCETIRRMKGFRNVLVHGYSKLDDETVYLNIQQGRNDLNQFIHEVRMCLNLVKT